VKIRQKTNKLDDMPSERPVDVVKAQTTAEWLEGIPPVRQIAVSIASLELLFLWDTKYKTIFVICVKHRLETVDKKIVFVIREWKALATAIVIYSINMKFLSICT
jgi:hypothetical protein